MLLAAADAVALCLSAAMTVVLEVNAALCRHDAVRAEHERIAQQTICMGVTHDHARDLGGQRL